MRINTEPQVELSMPNMENRISRALLYLSARDAPNAARLKGFLIVIWIVCHILFILATLLEPFPIGWSGMPATWRHFSSNVK